MGIFVAMSSPKTLVFYDGQCSMCVGVSGWLARLDHREQFTLVPYQQAEVLAQYPDLSPEACAKELHLISPSGSIKRGADAVLEIWKQTGHWSSFLAFVFLFPPFIWLARPVYQLIARCRRVFNA